MSVCQSNFVVDEAERDFDSKTMSIDVSFSSELSRERSPIKSVEDETRRYFRWPAAFPWRDRNEERPESVGRTSQMAKP